MQKQRARHFLHDSGMNVQHLIVQGLLPTDPCLKAKSRYSPRLWCLACRLDGQHWKSALDEDSDRYSEYAIFLSLRLSDFLPRRENLGQHRFDFAIQ